jgi:thioesterase III
MGSGMHATEIKVRGYHLDVFGHVNNARYLEFLEEARWALFDDKVNLEDLAKDGFVFTVVNININYRQAAFLHDVLRVETSMAEFGKRSAILRQTVINKATGVTIADADVTFVMVAIQEQKAAVLEGRLKERLMQVLEG